MSYTDVFGSDTIPPAGNAYDTYTLTTNTTFVWPYNAANTDTAIAKIMDVTPSAGVAMTFPPANDVSNGEDFLLRNVGAETLTVKDNAGTTIDTVAAGVSKYYFVSSNATAAGTWGSVTFGAGSSSATAGDLIGYGIKAITTTLNQKHTVTTDASNVTVDATYRAGLLVSTGGAVTIALTAAATLGNDFFFLYRNEGTGTATIDPNSSELFDGAATFTVQPGESLTAVCSGTAWYSVGYGRSTLYQFTQLVKDVSAAGEFVLSASEASNKLLSFTGNPASAVTAIVPNTVAIYYVQSAISTAQVITVKTAAGTGTEVAQSAKVILLCDATNVSTAQTAIASGGIALDSGSASAPSLNFSSSTNSGLFLKGATGVGIAVDGVEVIAVEDAGITLSQPLVDSKASTTFGVGNATPAASGAGLTFPATQSASTDVNTLDDYEEGTWTPVLSCTTVGNLSITYSSQSGTYTKIGRMVVVNCIIATSAFTHTTASSTIKITGLPFTPASQYVGAAILEYFNKWATDMWVCAFTPGGGNAYMYLSAARDGSIYRNLEITDFPSGSTPGIRFTVTYFV